MPDHEMKVWEPQHGFRLAKDVREPNDIMRVAPQLSVKDRNQIVQSFNAGSFEMVAEFVWNKTIRALKRQLSTLGMTFIAELLNRPDIEEDSNIEEVLTDFDAIRLAENLGAIGGTGGFRLRKAMETVYHFNNLADDEAADSEMSSDEAISILRACIENVLGLEKLDAAVDFARFRAELETRNFQKGDGEILRVVASPYFFQRTAVRVALSIIKTAEGAQLENALANTIVLVPTLWPRLEKAERWQVGRTYAELVSDGKKTASSALRKALLQVKGFDYVPEDLRSTTFVRVANKILAAHDGMDNYHNEPEPMRLLASLGSVIPAPAFPVCMTAVLSVRLGNPWGHSFNAQADAAKVLRSISESRWASFCNDYLPSDERLLYKLLEDKPRARWIELVEEFSLTPEGIGNPTAAALVRESRRKDDAQILRAVKKLIDRLGYKYE